MLKHLAATPALLGLIAGAAFAQDATTVAIPVGEWADAALPTVGAVLLAAIGWAMRQLPASIVAILKTAQVEQMLGKAIDYGMNTVKGASRDKVLEVDVGNAVIAQGVSYVVRNGPKWLVDWLGGEHGIRERILARLELSENAGAEPNVILQGTQPRA